MLPAFLWKVYGPDLDGRFGRLQGTGGLEAVILDADGTTTGVINDQFGNGVASVSGGTVTWYTTRVGAYGPLPGIQAQTLIDVTQVAASTAWRSRRMDPTGFYWLGARYYEPTSGRFLSADPMGQAASPSLYDFAGGDPVNSFDPTGRCQKMIDNFGQDQATQNFLNLNFGDVNAVNNFNGQYCDPNNQGGGNGWTFSSSNVLPNLKSIFYDDPIQVMNVVTGVLGEVSDYIDRYIIDRQAASAIPFLGELQYLPTGAQVLTQSQQVITNPRAQLMVLRTLDAYSSIFTDEGRLRNQPDYLSMVPPEKEEVWVIPPASKPYKYPPYKSRF